MKTSLLAQIEVKKPGAQKPDFSYQKTATNGSSFYGLEKPGF
ncbi:hypothetical protein [Flavobacterium limi]|nr:hypothetical protein [Flavobacterium limi]